MLSERSGVDNIALEGLMLISAFAGVVGAFLSGSALVGLLYALLAALGEAYPMGLLSAFTEGMTNGRGFIALAALLFGLAQAVTFRAPQDVIPQEFLLMLPYVLTIVVLAGFGGRAVAPAAIGKPYRKE